MRMEAEFLPYGSSKIAHRSLSKMVSSICRKIALLFVLSTLLPIVAVADGEAADKLLEAVARTDCAAVKKKLEAGASANTTFADFMAGMRARVDRINTLIRPNLMAQFVEYH